MSTSRQKISVDFHAEVKAKHVNAVGYKIIPQGVYAGGEVVFNNAVATIAQGTVVYLYAKNSLGESGYPVGLRVELAQDIQVTNLAADKLICLCLEWQESENMEVVAEVLTRESFWAMSDHYVVLCRIERNADGLNYKADYSVRTTPFAEKKIPAFYVDVLGKHANDLTRTSVYVHPGKLFIDRQYSELPEKVLKIIDQNNPRPRDNKVRFDMISINPYSGALSVLPGAEQDNFNTYPRIPRLTKVIAFIKRYPAQGTVGLYRQNDVILTEDIIQLGEQQDQNFEDNEPIGTICMFDGAVWEDNVTKPGWYACIAENAQHGCPDLVDAFIRGKENTGAVGSLSGVNSITIKKDELPQHEHPIASHAHSIPAHTHLIAEHLHRIPSHQHTVDAHHHQVGQHIHEERQHSHSLPGHNHAFKGYAPFLALETNYHAHWLFEAISSGADFTYQGHGYHSPDPRHVRIRRTAGGDWKYHMDAGFTGEEGPKTARSYGENHTHSLQVGQGAYTPVAANPTQQTNPSNGGGVLPNADYPTGLSSPGTSGSGELVTSTQEGGQTTQLNTAGLTTTQNGTSLQTLPNVTSNKSIDIRPKNYSLIFIRKCY